MEVYDNEKKREFSKKDFLAISDDSDPRVSGMGSERCTENHSEGLEKRLRGGG
jgi:hypothetical protein